MPEGTRAQLEVLPTDEAAGFAPTLLYRGTPLHDRVQPYREVLPLEGASPELVILFGVGLGYTAAGALHLCPAARVLAWEPVPEMAAVARDVLQREWNIAASVVLEEDLADFQARLIDALRRTRSAAVIELSTLAALEPGLAGRFREAVRAAIDATSLSAGAPLDAPCLQNVADNAPQLAGARSYTGTAGALAGVPGLAVPAVPGPEALASIRALHGSCCVVAAADAAPALAAAGAAPDVVVVRNTAAPDAAQWSAAGGAVLAICPESHPDWWTVPCAARFVFLHTGTPWLDPQDDLGTRATFAWGHELPVLLAALHAGLGPLYVSELPYGDDVRWNLLSAPVRRDMLLRRWAQSTSTELRELPPAGAPNPHAAAAPARFAATLRAAGSPFHGPDLAAAGRALDVLGRDLAHAATLAEPARSAYVTRRAESDTFTRALTATALAEGGDLCAALDGARTLLAAFGDPPRAAAPDAAGETVRVFIGALPGEEVPARVLLAAIERHTRARLAVRFVGPEIADALGPRAAALPRATWPFLVPALCGHEGRALYVEPSVLVQGDVLDAWNAPLGRHVALVPAEGPASIAVIDAGRAPWDAAFLERLFSGRETPAALLAAGSAPGIGALPEAWQARDEAPLLASAIRFTCEPWLPWKRDLHPAAWIWEAAFVLAATSGALGVNEVQRAEAQGHVRAGFAEAAKHLAAAAATVTR